MISQYNLTLQIEANLKTNNISTVLHGVLMDFLPNQLIEMLHQQSAYSPLKQRIIFSHDKSIWEIVSFHPEITNVLHDQLINLKSIYMKYHDVEVPVSAFAYQQYDMEELLDTYFNGKEPNRYVKLNIVTPMSFKTKGRHDVQPDVRRIFRSAMIQHDHFFDTYKMHDHDTLAFIDERVRIVDYRLRTTRFHLEGVRIPSFIGQMTMQINRPSHFKQLVHFLLFFGSLTGVGVKTALGMGKYQLLN